MKVAEGCDIWRARQVMEIQKDIYKARNPYYGFSTRTSRVTALTLFERSDCTGIDW